MPSLMAHHPPLTGSVQKVVRFIEWKYRIIKNSVSFYSLPSPNGYCLLFGCWCCVCRLPPAYENFTELMKILQRKKFGAFLYGKRTPNKRHRLTD